MEFRFFVDCDKMKGVLSVFLTGLELNISLDFRQQYDVRSGDLNKIMRSRVANSGDEATKSGF